MIIPDSGRMVLTITEFDSLYVPFQQAVEQATDIYMNIHN